LSGDVKLSLSKEPRLNEVVDAILECTPQCNIDTLVLTMKIMSGAQIISEKNVSKDSKQYSNKNFAKPRRGKTYKHTIKIKIIL
jgi:hypothetical protein